MAAALAPDILEAIQGRLRAKLEDRGIDYTVLADETRTEDAWYYVPVLFVGTPPRDLAPYEFLVEVEDEIEREFGIHVLLVPAI
jgi:hypothetical protein